MGLWKDSRQRFFVRVIDIAHSQSDPPHLDYTIFLKFDAFFALDLGSRAVVQSAVVVLDDEPQLLLGLAEHRG